MKHGIEVGMNVDEVQIGARLLHGIGRMDLDQYDEVIEGAVGEGLLLPSYATHVTRLNR